MKQKHNVNIEEYLNMVLWQNKPFRCIVYDFPRRIKPNPRPVPKKHWFNRPNYKTGSRFFLFGIFGLQDSSSHFEPSKGVKMRDPQEKKNSNYPQAELGLPHM